MLLRILCLWDIPSEHFDNVRAPLMATLGSTAGVDIFFAHRYKDDWQEIFKAHSINAFIFLSAQETEIDCLPRNFLGPVCILDLSGFYSEVDLSEHLKSDPGGACYPHTPSLKGRDFIAKDKEPYTISRFAPPFSLGALLSTLRKNLPSSPRSDTSQFTSLQTQGIIFERPHKRCIRHPKAGDIFLTEKEVAILDLLMEKAPQKLTKQAILEMVWGYLPHTSLNTHTLETHIYHLRQKFEEYGLGSIILSDHEGYAFNGNQNQG